MSQLDVSNLTTCVSDVRLAALDTDPGPPDPTNYQPLRGRLVSARPKLPPLYRNTLFDPYVMKLDELSENGFVQILLSDPTREGLAGLMMDIAHTILQNGEGYEEKATDAFQEVVSDLYDGFLSAEDRLGVQPPDKTVIPPLVKWGNPAFGPYTFTSAATENFDVQPDLVARVVGFDLLGIPDAALCRGEFDPCRVVSHCVFRTRGGWCGGAVMSGRQLLELSDVD